MQNYKVLNQIVLWNVFICTFRLLAMLIDVMGIPLSMNAFARPSETTSDPSL